jgi:hypothetical protein
MTYEQERKQASIVNQFRSFISIISPVVNSCLQKIELASSPLFLGVKHNHLFNIHEINNGEVTTHEQERNQVFR